MVRPLPLPGRRAYRVDWEISHDHSGDPVGFVRGGESDEEVLSQMEAFADLGDILRDLGQDEDA
jgi:hypothetical protein